MIKAVVFDLDGVFFQTGTAEFITKISSNYNVSRDDVVSVYLKSSQMQEFKKGLMSSADYWDHFVDHLRIEATKEELIYILLECYEVDTKTIELLDTLRKKGVKLAICTNNFPDRFEGLESKFGLRDLFDVIITSYDVGVTKPDPQIFKLLTEELELKPYEILMSDDREENVASLKDLGFKSVLYSSWKHFSQMVDMMTDPPLMEDVLAGRFTENIDYSITSHGSIWGPASEETKLFIIDNVTPDQYWIDLASGDGRYTNYIAQAAQGVVATDCDGNALGKLLFELPFELRDKVSVRRFDLLERFPFEDASIDGVFSAGTVYLFQKDHFSMICQEISRILVKNGTILLEFAVNIRRIDSNGEELIFGNEPLYNKEEAIYTIKEVFPNFRFEFSVGEKVEEHADSNPPYDFHSDTLLVKGKKV